MTKDEILDAEFKELLALKDAKVKDVCDSMGIEDRNILPMAVVNHVKYEALMHYVVGAVTEIKDRLNKLENKINV